LVSTTRSLGQRVARAAAARSSSRMMMSSEESPASFSHEKMDSDQRYKKVTEVPESLLQDGPENSKYSIKGQFKEGRAAYLDTSATTPMDPRVLDAMAPHMVSKLQASSPQTSRRDDHFSLFSFYYLCI
jgi:hypothetical protein